MQEDEMGSDLLFDPLEEEPKSAATWSPKNYVLTGNDIERVEQCPASRVFVAKREEKHAGVWFGIMVHIFLQKAATLGKRQALNWIRSKRNKQSQAVCERLDLSVLPEDSIAELPLSFNVETLEGWSLEYESQDPNLHVSTRADLLFEGTDGIWTVWDYKTGNKDGAVTPEGDLSLRTSAATVARMHDVDKVRVSIVTIDSKAGKLLPVSKLYKKKEMQKHEKRMQIAHALTMETRDEYHQEGIMPNMRPSPSVCRGCRAKTACSGWLVLK